MGYSARYHVASLAAVFLALAVGILVGAGLGDDLIKRGTENLEASLKSNLEDQRARNDDLQAELDREHNFSQEVYPALTANALQGQRVGVVTFGSLGDDVRDDVRAGLAPTGARIRSVAVVREPPDRAALYDAVGQDFLRKHGKGAEAFTTMARRAGSGLVRGDAFYARLRPALLSAFSGTEGRLDAVIVVRDEPADLSNTDAITTSRLEDGMLDGMTSTKAPVVGVERTDAESPSTGYFQSRGLSTVDDLDLAAGRLAMVFTLDGAQGNFGVGENAEALLPDLLHGAGGGQ